MARMHIIAGDGTRFESIADRRFIFRRIIAIFVLLATAIFLSAAIIGLQRAAIAPAPKPADHSLSFADAKKACAVVTPHTAPWADCINLFMRHAWHDSMNETPEGAAIVKDCISQYRGIELNDCFSQEIG